MNNPFNMFIYTYDYEGIHKNNEIPYAQKLVNWFRMIFQLYFQTNTLVCQKQFGNQFTLINSVTNDKTTKCSVHGANVSRCYECILLWQRWRMLYLADKKSTKNQVVKNLAMFSTVTFFTPMKSIKYSKYQGMMNCTLVAHWW